MSQSVITNAFEQLKAQQAANNSIVVLDGFVFANIPDLDVNLPISRDESWPADEYIVHRQAVGKTGMVNANAVAYSAVLGADVGDFEFNWIGLTSTASDTVCMIVHAPLQKKIKTTAGQQGNVLTRSFLMEYSGASEQTQIITPVDTWQIDFTARLNGVDERIRRENMDTFGAASFIGDGFKVSASQAGYAIKRGVGYVAGIRTTLIADQEITVSQRPAKVWVDVCWRGTLTSAWAEFSKIVVAESLTDYIENDEQHYVFAIAEITANGSVNDLRPISVAGQMSALNPEPKTLPYFDGNKNLGLIAITDFGREVVKQPTTSDVQELIGLRDVDSVKKYPALHMARWRDEGDVRFWGAVMDGVTDDTAALKAAFSSGAHVVIPKPKAGKFMLINDTILIADGTTIVGPGRDYIVIKCADDMAPNKHALVSSNYMAGIQTPNKNIHIEGVCIDGNGYVRAPGVEKPEGCNFVINADGASVVNCHSIAAPLWNFFFTSGNPFEEVGHVGAVIAPSANVNFDRCISTDPIHGDGTIFQGVWGFKVSSYTSIFTSRLVTTFNKVRQDCGIQFIEGCREGMADKIYCDHANSVTTAVGISGHANKPYLAGILVDTVVAKNLNTAVGIFNDAAVVPVGAKSWQSRRFTVRNIHLQHPVIDVSNDVMQARLVDVQNAMSVDVSNVSVDFLDESGSYSSPTAVINFSGVHDFTLEGADFKNVPDVGSAQYRINRGRGWIAVAETNNRRGRIGKVRMDNIGYYNRVVTDTGSLCLEEVNGVVVDAVPSDGQAKVAIVCGSSSVSVRNINLPGGMTLGTIGPLYAAMLQGNTDVNVGDRKYIYGGQTIRAHNPSGVQDAPGILFDRHFVSANSRNGKGALAFRTSSAVNGTLGVTAFNEDDGIHHPIHSTNYNLSAATAKSLTPVVNGDTNFGAASVAWLNGYFVNSPQTVSDARQKTAVRELTGQEIGAGVEIVKTLGFWSWLDGRGDREHAGTTVQSVIAILEKHGLEPFNYAFVTYEKWDDEFTTVYEYNEDGSEIENSGVRVQTKKAGDIYGFKVQELTLYLIRCLADKLLADV